VRFRHVAAPPLFFETVKEAIEIALIVSTPPTVVGLASLIVAIRGLDKTHQLHVLINSGMTARDNAMKAEGRQQERDSK
jgi:hypothetical protein